MGGPKKFSKPGQNINLKANHTNFCSNCHKIKLCVRPEARASAQAPGMLGPPMPISLILFVTRAREAVGAGENALIFGHTNYYKLLTKVPSTSR